MPGPITSPGAIITNAVNPQTGTSYTPVLADAGKIIPITNPAAITFTVPPQSSVPFPFGPTNAAVLQVMQGGAGTVTIAPGAGVTINGLTSVRTINGQGGIVSLFQITQDVWQIRGDLGPAPGAFTTIAGTIITANGPATSQPSGQIQLLNSLNGAVFGTIWLENNEGGDMRYYAGGKRHYWEVPGARTYLDANGNGASLRVGADTDNSKSSCINLEVLIQTDANNPLIYWHTAGSNKTCGFSRGTVADGGGIMANSVDIVQFAGTYFQSLVELQTAAGKTLKVISGINAKSGTFTLVAGTATVGNTSVTSGSVVSCALKTSGGTPGIYAPQITLNPGTGFTANGLATDTSTYNYIITEVG